MKDVTAVSSTQPDKYLLNTPFGSHRLRRWPLIDNDALQAWDASDELILIELAEQHSDKLRQLEAMGQRILIVNDAFGALSTCLNQYGRCSWGDSKISQLAAKYNNNNQTDNAIVDNHLQQKNNLTFVNSMSLPDHNYEFVLIKIPKTSALLEQQLLAIRNLVNKDCIIIAAGMSKHIHSSTMKLFTQCLGPTSSSRATKKARLIFCEPLSNQKEKSFIPPRIFNYYCQEISNELISYANGFSKNNLDLGARILIDAFKKNEHPRSQYLLDLGCGNGVLGIAAAKTIIHKNNSEMTVDFIDESFMAVAASRENFNRAIGDTAQCNARFYVEDGLDNSDNQYDWIVCNPPFHRGNTIETNTAKKMFSQSFRHLNSKGQLWIVGNSHLHYERALQHVFSNHKVLFKNHRFAVICATKTD